MSHGLSPEDLARVQAEFDAAFYLSANKDVADAGADPFEHFMVFGAREGRDPRPDFFLRRYLDLNVDVKEAGVNGFVHWVLNGRAEGRATDHGLGWRYEILWTHKPIEARLRDLARSIPDRAADPIQALSAALDPLASGRPLHITVSHDDYSRGVGGVQLCIRLEAAALAAEGRDHIHLFPYAANVVVDVEREAPTLGVLVNGVLAGFFTPEDIAAALGSWASGRTASLAIHSLIGHPIPRTLAILKAMGLTEGFYWLHDFASLCAGYALMRDDVAFCGAPPPESAACEVCTYGRRRRIQVPAHIEMFQALDLTVAAPSSSAMDLWKARFPLHAPRTVVHPHATLTPRAVQPPRAQPAEGRPLRVAFLGMPSVMKGWPVFSELARRFADDPRYEFHHLSAVRDPRVPARFTPVKPTSDQPQPMIPAIEALGIDVVVQWSLWPETFCIAAFEAVAAGAAVLTQPAAGNVPAFVAADPARGQVLADEAVLTDLFDSGDALGLSRAARAPLLHDLAFSRMTADLVLETAP